MRLREVTNHYVIDGEGTDNYNSVIPSKKLPKNAKLWFNKWEVGESTNAIVATHNGKLVGFFRFAIEGKNRTELTTCGTWCSANFRKHGLAFRMWTIVIKKYQPKYIYSVTMSLGGKRLLKKICEQFGYTKSRSKYYPCYRKVKTHALSK
jgi:hypothetical protein